MAGPSIAIDLEAIAHNAHVLSERCRAHGITIAGVTKAVCGSPMVARAMLRGGVAGLADSRLDNIARLRRNGINAPIMMLRIPSISEADEVVRLCDASLNSEIAALRALDQAAVQQGAVHDVIVMLEMGDRREGVSAEELPRVCEVAMRAEGLALAGIGANFMCTSGVLPSRDKLASLAMQAEAIEQRFGVTLRYVSGGNTANLPTLDSDPPPAKINHLRLGASLLLGENVRTGGTLAGLRDDAFTLEAELIEIKTKPSLPEGEIGTDAFGETPVFADKGERVRGIVNLGRVDSPFQGLKPRAADIEIVAASSDHLIVDLTHAPRFAVGDRLAFGLSYAALVQTMLSPYLDHRLVGRDSVAPRPKRLRLMASPALAQRRETAAFLGAVAELGLAPVRGDTCEIDDLPLHISMRRIVPGHHEHGRELGVVCIDAEPADLAILPPEASALVALQRASPAQAARIRETGMLALTMEDVDLIGVRESMRRALQRVTTATDGFILVLHTSAARGMDADPMEAGLSYRECSLAMELVAASEGLRAVALCGVGDAIPSAALDTAYAYVLSALGKRILA